MAHSNGTRPQQSLTASWRSTGLGASSLVIRRHAGPVVVRGAVQCLTARQQKVIRQAWSALLLERRSLIPGDQPLRHTLWVIDMIDDPSAGSGEGMFRVRQWRGARKGAHLTFWGNWAHTRQAVRWVAEALKVLGATVAADVDESPLWGRLEHATPVSAS